MYSQTSVYEYPTSEIDTELGEIIEYRNYLTGTTSKIQTENYSPKYPLRYHEKDTIGGEKGDAFSFSSFVVGFCCWQGGLVVYLFNPDKYNKVQKRSYCIGVSSYLLVSVGYILIGEFILFDELPIYIF